jgi:aminoglycoside N3'-acetyltransferase
MQLFLLNSFILVLNHNFNSTTALHCSTNNFKKIQKINPNKSKKNKKKKNQKIEKIKI